MRNLLIIGLVILMSIALGLYIDHKIEEVTAVFIYIYSCIVIYINIKKEKKDE